MKKKIVIFNLIAVTVIMTVIGLTTQSCSESENWDVTPERKNREAIIVGGRTVYMTDNDENTLGGSSPEKASLLQLTLESAEVDVSNTPTLNLDVTVSMSLNETTGKEIEYSTSDNETTPGVFSKSNSLKLKNGDILWVKIQRIGGAATFYKIKITIKYDAKALSAEEFTIVFSPASRAYTTGANIAPLSAEVSKSAIYNVQWFTNTKMSNTGGTAIAAPVRVTDSKFTHTLETLSAENNYYYVVVTNETGSKTSAPALISVTASGIPVPNVFQISATRYNYIRGVGGTGAFMFREGDNADASPDADVTYVNKLFQELGCNNLRIMVQDDYLNYVQNRVQSRNQAVFYHDARKNFFAVIRRVNELGGYVFAQPWTAPASMKTNNSVSGGGGGANPGLLRTESYINYANYLRDFLKWLNENNAPIFLLGILNEPDYGQTAAYEGMGMTGEASRNWFNLVGHFTTQRVTNPTTATVDNVQYAADIIPGYGGGSPTHHVLVMSGDSAGRVSTYMNPQLEDRSSANNANDRQEVVGRHYYYDSGPRYTQFVGTGVAGNGGAVESGVLGTHGNPVTTWEQRGTGTGGNLNSFSPHYNMATVLASSPQMFPPDSTSTNVKREIWQTEHDYNHGSSTDPNVTNAYTFWNAAFTAMNWLDYTFRIAGESLSNWWFSSSFSGYVTSNHTVGWPTPYYITPRGRAIAHYARYVNETWLIGVERTEGNLAFNNGGTLNAGSTVPKITAFEDKDGKFISVVMFTPTTSPNNGAIGGGFGSGGVNGNDDPTNGSVNAGRLRLVLPDGYTAGSATAIRSWGKSEGQYWQDEPVFLSEDGKSAEVTLPGGNIISIRFMLKK